VIAVAAVALTLVACSNTKVGFVPEQDAGEVPAGEFAPAEPLPETDHFAKDPPPQWCGPANGKKPPAPPGGTEACPSDKNKPGCACDSVGEKAACWTGLRANRKLGICKDGTTTCTQLSETVRGWGPCEGQVLPASGATEGKSACKCFSAGKWELENAVPCTGTNFAVSTIMNSVTGKPECPPVPGGANAIPAKPSVPWSNSKLTVDCEGNYELCMELKAGTVTSPQPSDCSIARVCVKTDYLQAGVAQVMPPLPSWLSTDATCAQRFLSVGGYAEMTVKGLSVTCDKIDDGAGKPIVFRRAGYCPTRCQTQPTLPECAACASGGSGEF